jgi:hypothetical protein
LNELRQLETLEVTLRYGQRNLRVIEEQVKRLARDLEKVRIDMKDSEWVLPVLPDDLFGVISTLPQVSAQESLFEDPQEPGGE